MGNTYNIPTLPLRYDLETKAVLRQVNRANKKLAELKGIARAIPNENILISTLALQEAKDSSFVENIVTTQDDLYRADLRLKQDVVNASAKEVLNYREAIQKGFSIVRNKHILTNNDIKIIQSTLVHNEAGFRRVPGTTLKRSDGINVYTPPQDNAMIVKYMDNLEHFINDDRLCDYDPLVKMAIIHHQFESIHPFYDGNGRTGRIVNVLYLVISGLLDLPILYLSRYITHNKAQYYALMQEIRDKNENNESEWEAWILFILKGIEVTSSETIQLIQKISFLMNEYKKVLRPLFGKTYKHELLNNLFFHPYTKVEFVERDMQVERRTATKYLKMMEGKGILSRVKIGNTNFYINTGLVQLFIDVPTDKNDYADNSIIKETSSKVD